MSGYLPKIPRVQHREEYVHTDAEHVRNLHLRSRSHARDRRDGSRDPALVPRGPLRVSPPPRDLAPDDGWLARVAFGARPEDELSWAAATCACDLLEGPGSRAVAGRRGGPEPIPLADPGVPTISRPPPARPELLVRGLDELGISSQRRAMLEALGVQRLETLVALDEVTLLRNTRLGRKGCNEVKEALARLGLALASR
jgi:hypothetical protein